MKGDSILKALGSGKKNLEELRSELNLEERELKKELKNLAKNGSIEKDNDIYKLKVKKTENKKNFTKGKIFVPNQKLIVSDSGKKNYLPLVLLAFIVILGFYLRIYHIDYPSIGYHNNKDVHYLTEARNFAREGFFKYGFFVPIVGYVSLDVDPSGAHGDTFPTTPILVAIAFMLFGMQLWIARLIGILFVVGTIPLIYIITKKLFWREDLALVSALLTAVLPILVFFSHNVDVINPGIFFMVLSAYFYITWRESNKGSELILASLSLTIATLTKYPFFFIVIPMLLTFPYKRLFEWRKHISVYMISLLILSSFPIWVLYSNSLQKEFGRQDLVSSKSINLYIFFQDTWWATQKSYVKDSFTIAGIAMAFLSIPLLFFSYYKRRDIGSKFLLSYVLGSIIYVVVVADRLNGHSYYYYVVAPLIVMLVAYFIIQIGDFFKRLKVEGREIGYINLIPVIIILALLSTPLKDSIDRQFNTQFYGLDVAGEYLKEHKKPGEQLMHSTHQAFGVVWHSDMKSVKGIPDTVEDMKSVEETRNASWIFMYNWDFGTKMKNEKLWSYIKNNYGLKQFGFIQTSQGVEPLYLLLQKEGTFDDSKLNTLLAGKPINYKDYELTMGKVRFSYINL